jgi:hypothetical protein
MKTVSTVDTAKVVDPNSRVRARTQLTSYTRAKAPERKKSAKTSEVNGRLFRGDAFLCGALWKGGCVGIESKDRGLPAWGDSQ